MIKLKKTIFVAVDEFYELRFTVFQVDLERSYYFRNSKRTYTGIPVMASNMDTVGTFEMAKTLSKVLFYVAWIVLIKVIHVYLSNNYVDCKTICYMHQRTST